MRAFLHMDPFVISTLVLWGGIFLFFVRYRFSVKKKCSVEVVATVVDVTEHKYHSSHGSGYTYQPTFTYEWKGFTRTIRSEVRSTAMHFEIGEQVVLLIDPEDASNFRFKSLRYDPVSQICILTLIVPVIILAALLKK